MAKTIDSKLKANKKYRMKKLSDGTKKQINATINTEDYNLIDTYCKEKGISKAALIVGSARYVIRNNIDIIKQKSEDDLQ